MTVTNDKMSKYPNIASELGNK